MKPSAPAFRQPPDAAAFEGPALVLGLGSSGCAAARLLRARGVEVTALDESDHPGPVAAAEQLRAEGIHARAGARGPLPAGPFRVAVVSPGLDPERSPWIAELRARNTPIRAEFELGWLARGETRVLAVTGSNGKSSVVKLIAESLANTGHASAPCGNYGTPVCAQAMAAPVETWVMEVSSFQLQLARDFAPEISVLLNLQPNHLDRHGTMEAYREAKTRIFQHSGPGASVVVPASLAALADTARARGARIRTFGVDGQTDADALWQPGRIVRRDPAAAVDIQGSYFDNPVLGAAAAAAVAAVDLFGGDVEGVGRSARNFEPLPHRMQPVGEGRGVRWINDSKATSTAALQAALRMLGGTRGIRLLAGGRPKESNFDSVNKMLASCVRKLYLFGECAERLHDVWSAIAPAECFPSLTEAAEQAARDAEAGEIILLSPACTSFDQFRNFEERGDAFASLARRWCGGRECGQGGSRKSA
ncbi:MAG: UDP-N-acetylmuramoyl-L-alanine--D-glutamate ligase [Kiritimatiellae bacterium]|nr:UDP-N-acetylmuramoyl-L-alanine--D-glutamate ligase [Kiritimatiellia bacterium]